MQNHMIVWLRDCMFVCYRCLLSIRHDKRVACMKISKTQIALLSTLELFFVWLKWFASQPQAPRMRLSPLTHTDQIMLKHTLFVLKWDLAGAVCFCLKIVRWRLSWRECQDSCTYNLAWNLLTREMLWTSYSMYFIYSLFTKAVFIF